MTDLEAEAANPATSASRLQELATEYARLRPLIAMNPAAYPALVQWLGDLDDPAVNVALAQRNAANGFPAGAPKRISVMGRSEESAAQNTGLRPTSQPAGARPGLSPLPEDHPHPSVSAAAVPAVAAVHPRSSAEMQGSRSKRNGALIALILAAVAVLTLGFLFVSGLLPRVGGEDQDSATTEPDEGVAAAREDDLDTEESGAPVATEAPIIYPAPSSALPLSHFVSPSGNIACQINETQVTCTINSHSFADADTPTCGAGPLSVAASADQAGLSCSANQVEGAGAVTLSYTDAAASGDYACTSTEYGVSCWNIRTGTGFGLARGGYQVTKSGPIETSTFPWN